MSFSEQATYQYAANNPVMFNDPNGAYASVSRTWKEQAEFLSHPSLGSYVPTEGGGGGMHGRTGGPGSGFHWTDDVRSVFGNMMLMWTGTFANFYNFAGMSDWQKADFVNRSGIGTASVLVPIYENSGKGSVVLDHATETPVWRGEKKIVGYEWAPAQQGDPCPPGVDCKSKLREVNKALTFNSALELSFAGTQIGMLNYRQGISIAGKLGTFRYFSSTYRTIGFGTKVLGTTSTYVAAPLSIGMDVHDATLPEGDPNHIGTGRAMFRITGTLSSILIGAKVGSASGTPLGVAAGAGVGGVFTAFELSWDGIVWFGNELSRAAVQFNNGWRSGWLPGKH